MFVKAEDPPLPSITTPPYGSQIFPPFAYPPVILNSAAVATALGGGGGMTTRHIRNFIESIRGNESPKAPISVGAVSTHLANYINAAAKSKRQRLMVDPKTGQLKDKEAMKMFWGRTYEPGWELTL